MAYKGVKIQRNEGRRKTERRTKGRRRTNFWVQRERKKRGSERESRRTV